MSTIAEYRNRNWYNDEILRWVVMNKLQNSLGIPFEFKHHAFLIDPMCDWHPRQGSNKSAQIGYSESIGVLKSLFAAQVLKLNVIYTLPSDAFVSKFVPPKVDTIISNNQHVLRASGGVTLKEFNISASPRRKGISRFVYFLGTHNSKSAEKKEETSKGIAITSDLNIHDEDTRSDQFTINQLRSRQKNSNYGGIWRFSNPTYPGVGSDRIYQMSDQRHWIIKCSRCNYRQYLDWYRLDKHEFESGTSHCWVDPDRKEFICGGCKKPISDYDRMTGEWIAKHPSIEDYRGYWINELMYVHHTVKSIMEEEEDPDTSPSNFYNFALGKPYLNTDTKLTRSTILANITGDVNAGVVQESGNAMGIDQSHEWKHYVIGNEEGIFLVGKTKDWDELLILANKYKAHVVVDALPYQRYPKKWAREYPNRFWRAFFRPQADQTDMAKFISEQGEDDPGKVLIKREEVFDILVDKFVNNSFGIQVPEAELDEFIEHWERLVRIVEQDAHGNDRFKWIKANTPCDYPFATLYYYIALTSRKSGRAKGLSLNSVPKSKQGVYLNPDGSLDQNIIKDAIEAQFDRNNST